MDILKYCMGCFKDTQPDLCELYRHRFIFLHQLPRTTYLLVKKLVEEDEGIFRAMPGRRWGFETTKENHQHILNMLNICSVPVHTLEEHIYNLENRYNLEPLILGKNCYLNLPEGEEWSVFDPQTRSWSGIIPTYQGVLVREGGILSCYMKGQTKFYWFQGLDEDGTPKILELQKRAAWNVAARYFKKKSVFWIEHRELGVGVIICDSLGNLPDDIFSTLVRFCPYDKYVPALFIFELGDFELIQRVLGCINTQIIKSTDVIMLPGDSDKLHSTPVIPLSEIPERRISSIKAILLGMTGSEVKLTDNSIEIPVTGGNLKIVFIGRSKECVLDKTFYVPVNEVGNVGTIYKLMLAISKYLKIDVNMMEELFVFNWVVENDIDAKFMLDDFIHNINNAGFVHKFLRIPENRALVREWYETLTKNYLKTSVPLDILRKVSKYLTE